MPDEELTLADVDGTVPGRAALVIIRLDPDNPEQRHTIFTEDGEFPCPDPIAYARNSWDDDTRADFPEHFHAIVSNPRARYIAWKRRMKGLIGGSRDDHTPEQYLEIARKDARR